MPPGSNPPLGRFHRRIQEKADDPWAPPVLIVAFGDSVTQGATVLDEFAHEDVYHARFKRLLEERYQQSTFSVINAGVGGQTAAGALALIERDVIRHQPDLTLVSFGLNDVWAGLDGLHDFASGMTEIIRQVRDHTESELILLTPNFMVTREGPGVERELQSLTRAAVDLQRGGVLAAYASAIRELGREHALPCADIYGAWEELAAQGADVNQLLANGLNHPTADAHAIAARLLMAIVMSAEATDESRDMRRRG